MHNITNKKQTKKKRKMFILHVKLKRSLPVLSGLFLVQTNRPVFVKLDIESSNIDCMRLMKPRFTSIMSAKLMKLVM